MRFEAIVHIEAPVDHVWQFLQNDQILGVCAGHGVQPASLERDGATLHASLTVMVGGMPLACAATLTWLETQPPLRASLQADIWVRQPDAPPPGNAPHVTVLNTLQLEAVSASRATLFWQARVQLHHRLSQAPQSVVKSLVAQQSRSFFTCFKAAAEQPADGC